MKKILSIALLFAFSSCFAAEEATVKIIPNRPVSYFAKIDVDVKQKLKNGPAERAVAKLETNFDLEISNTKKTPYLLVTPNRFNFDLKTGGLSIAYDTKKALSGNPIPAEKAALENSLGKVHRIPLTTDPEYTPEDLSDQYLIPPPSEPYIHQIFVKSVKEVMEAIDPGHVFKVGDVKEEHHDDANGKFNRTTTVTRIDEEQVVLDEQVTLDMTWKNDEEGSLHIFGNGSMKKNVSRNDLMITNAKGSFNFTVEEIPGQKGKQMLDDGDLLVKVDIELTPEKEKKK